MTVSPAWAVALFGATVTFRTGRTTLTGAAWAPTLPPWTAKFAAFWSAVPATFPVVFRTTVV